MKNKKIVKICIFDKHTPKSVALTGNGDEILDSICIKCESTESLDGSGTYELDATFIVDKEGKHKHVVDEAILKVHMDYGDEIFRIAKANKRGRDITVFARQITIPETIDLWLEDTRPTNTGGQGALSAMLAGAIGTKELEVYSNISTISTAYYQRMCMYKALHDTEQSFMNRWGGEIQRRGYALRIDNRIGIDRGVEIRSRKNLTGFEANTNIDNVCTRIRPVGFDGITTGTFVDSPLIGKYSRIKTKEIKYDDVKVKNENNPDEGFDTLPQAQAELIRRAELEFSQNRIDELRGDYRINFVYLEDTEEYKDYVQAERVYIGDTVSVYEEKHDIKIQVRVIQKRYDVLRQKVIEIELSNTDISNKTISTTDILSELQSIIKGTENNNVQDIIQSMINSGIKDSYVIPRQNEVIIADNKDLNLANNVCRLNKNGLGFSKTGYYGDYEYGFTIDGVINASLIATGILSTILIQNADGSLQIDLSGTKGIMTKKNGKNAIELAGQVINFYDWDGIGEPIGKVYSSRFGGAANMPGIVMANEINSFMALSYKKGDTYVPYILFDKDDIEPNSKSPITVNEDIDFKGSQFWFGHGLNSIFNSSNNDFILKAINDFIVADMANGNPRFRVNSDNFTFWDDLVAYFYKNANQNSLWSLYDFNVDKNMHVNGNFTVSGTKNCVQKTEHYGDRLFYSVEDCESYLTDSGKSITALTVENTYERVILIDNVYKQSADVSDYHISIDKYDWGDYRIKEQTQDYFIVESEKEMNFSWTIKAKRRGYEDVRNEEVWIDEAQNHTIAPMTNETVKEEEI